MSRWQIFRRARLLAVCFLVLAASLPAYAQDSSDEEYLRDRLENDAELNQTQAEIDQLNAEQSAAGERIATLELSTAEVEAEIARLAQQITDQESHVRAIAERQAQVADLQVAADMALQRAEAAHAAQQQLFTARLVNMYIFSTEHKTALSWEVSDVNDLEARHILLTTIGEYDKGLLESIDDAAAEIDVRRAKLAEAAREGDELAAEAGAALAGLNGSRDEQSELRAHLQARIDDLHHEINELEAAQAEVEAILTQRRETIILEAAERDRLRAICFANPRRPIDGDGTWVDCLSVGVVVPPTAVRWPINEVVTSEYGPRWGRMHEGIDLAGALGAPIMAAESGRVVYAGWVRGYGNTLVIDHGGGMSTLYAHLHGFNVPSGATVSVGEVVAFVGNTGHSTGPHLHFEVRIGGAAVNPREYLP